MVTYPYNADIEVSKLRLDLKNPRLSHEPDSQLDAFEDMADVQGAKLLPICRHIATYGLSPATRFIAIPDDRDQFIVLDANRRLTALRALEHPNLVKGHLPEAEMKQLRTLSASFSPPDDVPCVVFEKREDAAVWIELLHDGESEGAGLVGWSAQQKARYRARSGGKAPHLQVLDFTRAVGATSLSPKTTRRIDRGSFPLSTLERALSTPAVREALGIELSEGQVTTQYPKGEVIKGLIKLVDDIGSGAIKVGDLMKATDRVAYVDGFKDSELPDAKTKGDTSAVLGDAPEKTRGKAGRDKRASGSRTKLIPAEFTLSITRPRLHDIYLELKRKLRVDEVPNAAGVLLRVFLELSVDEFIEKNSVTMPGKDPMPRLDKKVLAVADYMEEQGLMSGKQVLLIREAMKSDDKLTLATNLNQLVHNRDMVVAGSDLKALWTRLGLFFEKLWAP